MDQVFLMSGKKQARTHTIVLGRKELTFSFVSGFSLLWRKKRGRPKKTAWQGAKEFFFYLEKVWKDNRFTGNRASRVLRRVFELRQIKEIWGVGMVGLGLMFGGLLRPAPAIWAKIKVGQTNVAPVCELSVETEKAVNNPLPFFILSQGYHVFHQAIDLKGALRTPIEPIMAGRVETVARSNFAYGNYVVVHHGGEYRSLYAHMGEVLVEENEIVGKESVLGAVGMTGFTTGPHLHLEIWEGTKRVNPLLFLESKQD